MYDQISVRQIKAARALLAWSQEDLTAQSGVSFTTIARLEATSEQLGGYASTREKIVTALTSAGVSFINGTDGEEGVMVRRHKP